MRLPLILAAIIAIAAPLRAQTAEVYIDRAEMFKLALPYHLNSIARLAKTTPEQQKQVEQILNDELDRVVVIQKEYHKTKDLTKLIKDLVNDNVKTAVALRGILEKKQAASLAPYFDERRSNMVSMMESSINTLWYDAAEKAGFTPQF